MKRRPPAAKPGEKGRGNMKRMYNDSLDFHMEETTFSRSFDTLEQAEKFAEGKDVRDIYRSKGRYKVEWTKTVRVDHFKKVFFDGEEITPEAALKLFCWCEIIAAMEKQPDALKETARYMDITANRNVPDWEYRFLKNFLWFADNDLVIEQKVF